ncbi:MAG TPA: 2Fe-2S iron-sulfur cluster-binding protein [Bryobacteraceae bacterium]|nr:2Fe-2S iron-sulfur cluster-binding protein [Bryobacteraceae bacterium]
MPKVLFLLCDGSEQLVEVPVGFTLMEGARQADVPGIIAECGGGQTCGTCHVYIEKEWRERVGGPSASEAEMLDFAPESNESSRLSCQIEMQDELDGLVVRVPFTQLEA